MDTVRKTRYESYAYEACPVEATLEMMGGKGKGMILYHLISGIKRFNEPETAPDIYYPAYADKTVTGA